MLAEAVEAIEDGNMSLRGAARHFNVPKSSTSDHLYGRTTHRKRGAKGTLTTDEDLQVVN